MFRQIIAVFTLAMCYGLLSGCATAPGTSEEKKTLEDDAAKVIATATKEDPDMGKFLSAANGYAVFPAVGKGGVGVGGAYGKGTLYQQGKVIGYCDLSQASIGLQLGGQKFSEIICFETPATLDKFKSGEMTFAAQVSAVALKAGVGANAKYSDGVAVFTMGEAGLMYEASVGGQKFTYQAK